MKFSSILAIAVTATPVFAIIPEAVLNTPPDSHEQPTKLSLQNLLEISDVNDLLTNWQITGSMQFGAGRLFVDQSAGALWSKELLDNLKSEWTIELTFRNSEQEDVDDHTYFDTNGLAFWLLDEASPTSGTNFGGPEKFEGFEFLINNKKERGLKIFANDGSKVLENPEGSFGGCAINYLDSMVPFTLRISYSQAKNWFKVQIDNNLCFKTDQLTLDRISLNLRFGVSASTNQKSKEYWEVLKLEVFDGLTTDAIDDHGIITGGLIQVKTVTQEVKQPVETHHPSVNRESLMERTQKFREEMKKSQPDVYQQLSDIRASLSAIEGTSNKPDSAISALVERIGQIESTQNLQLQLLNDIIANYDKFDALVKSQYRETSDALMVLNNKVLDEIKIHQVEVHEMSAKVDLLMDNHKGLQSQPLTPNIPDVSEFFSAVVKWVLIPIVLGIAVLSAFVHRLRKDIKHLKLL